MIKVTQGLKVLCCWLERWEQIPVALLAGQTTPNHIKLCYWSVHTSCYQLQKDWYKHDFHPVTLWPNTVKHGSLIPYANCQASQLNKSEYISSSLCSLASLCMLNGLNQILTVLCTICDKGSSRVFNESAAVHIPASALWLKLCLLIHCTVGILSKCYITGRPVESVKRDVISCFTLVFLYLAIYIFSWANATT